MSSIQRLMFRSKIHRATVTDANLDYEGSVTISSELMEAAGIYEFEQIHIWNVTRGTRLVTYTISGPKNSGVICINGAGAHLVKKDDIVILATFAEMPEALAKIHKPTVILVNALNQIVSQSGQEQLLEVSA